jgi:hypothetical protein
LIGGAERASRVIMVGWGEGLEEVARYLNELPNAERLVVKAHYHHVLRPLFVGTTTRLVDETSVDYFVVYVNMVQRQLMPPAMVSIMAQRPPDFTVEVHGVPYAWLYRVDQPIEPEPSHILESEDESGT